MTACVHDPIFQHAHRRTGHPEQPGRIAAVLLELERRGLLARLQPVAARRATRRELESVHAPELLDLLERRCAEGDGMLDADTFYQGDSWDLACRAVGGLIDLTLDVCAGRHPNGLALTRPPGHHATREQAMGFCLLNSIAAAAAQARGPGGVRRVAIVDIDVHHGNGTEAIFAGDPDVLFVSTHQYPLFPGSGAVADRGTGSGLGATVNIPVPVGTGDGGLGQAHLEVIAPLLRRFRPGLILVSAGFDTHRDDPLAGLVATTAGCGWISRHLIRLADELCAGRIVFTLEGGYHEGALAACLADTAAALLDGPGPADEPPPPAAGEPDLSLRLQAVRRLHGLEA